MDIKLKEKKCNLRVLVLFLIVCISLMISFSVFLKSVLRQPSPYEEQEAGISLELSQIYNSVDDLMLYTHGLYGEIREDSIEAECQNIKAKVDLFKKDESQGLTVDEKYLNMTDEDIKQDVIRNFKLNIQDKLQVIERHKNIEFYCESSDGTLHFTNTNSESKEEFEQDTLDNYKEYIILKPNDKMKTSKNLEKIVYGIQNLSRNHDFYFRISQPLEKGDYIYEIIKEYESKMIQGYISIGILVIAFIGFIFCFRKLRHKDFSSLLKLKLVKLLSKIDVEIKVLLIGGMFLSELVSLRHISYIIDVIFDFIILFIELYLLVLELIRIKVSYKKIKEFLLNESVIARVIRCLKGSRLSIILLFIAVNILIVPALFFVFIMFFRSGRPAILSALIGMLLFDRYIVSIVGSISKIEIQSNNIANGIYDDKIDIGGLKVLKDIGTNLKNIQSGLETAVDKAVKSEKMKAELITNISHDLKTPLTSIISYVDLLNQENITEEQRKKYLTVLNDKSNRLKVLIEDLFEVSKASSGSMELKMEDIDSVALLRQTLGEFEDKLKESNLKIIKKLPEEKLMIYADGRKTFRVFQNLLSNIFKYSMEGSRVYIDINDAGEYVEVIFKNTSREELNFTEEEILQRFKRGDTSRTTEGSGLGLAIAKSLTEVQGGLFEIKLDGDLFKAIVKLKKENKY